MILRMIFRRTIRRRACGADRLRGRRFQRFDDLHTSLSTLPCAEKAVHFFETGEPITASCPGAPIKEPSQD